MSQDNSAVFTVLPTPGGGFQPHISMQVTEEWWIFTAEPCRLETKVSIQIRPDELVFILEYNNAGAKQYTEEQAFKLPHTPMPGDLIIEGYRTKSIRLRRPPPRDDIFFL